MVVEVGRGAATARAVNVFRLNRDTTTAVHEGHSLPTRIEGALQDRPGGWLAGGELADRSDTHAP